jgi:hypothetical protein
LTKKNDGSSRQASNIRSASEPACRLNPRLRHRSQLCRILFSERQFDRPTPRCHDLQPVLAKTRPIWESDKVEMNPSITTTFPGINPSSRMRPAPVEILFSSLSPRALSRKPDEFCGVDEKPHQIHRFTPLSQAPPQAPASSAIPQFGNLQRMGLGCLFN